MCYAIPGCVKEFNGKFAIVDYFGEEKKAVNEIIGLKPGDYVYAQGGYVISRVSRQEALSTLETWKDLFFELRQIDAASSRLTPWGVKKFDRLHALMEKSRAGAAFTHEEIFYLLNIRNPSEKEFLFSAANHLRQEYHSNSCCVHGIIEISNHCAQPCAYCGISCLNYDLIRYRMSMEDILDSIDAAVNVHGFKAVVLQSGEDPGRSIGELVDIVAEIKRRFEVLVFISFGELGREGLTRLWKAGARGVLMRFETSSPEQYAQFHPGSRLEDRLEEIRFANETGFLILTGSMLGLPGQTYDDVARDLHLARELNTEMLSIGPFLPHPATSMSSFGPVVSAHVVHVLAVARLVMPRDTKILVTTGLETLDPHARRAGLMAGANSVMLNVTPVEKRALYQIYPGRAHQEDPVSLQIHQTIELLRSIGRAPTDLSIKQG